MKKEDLKAAIKANFENNEFATAMELNKDLFQEYENVAGKRSLSSIVSFYKKKSESAVEEVSVTSEEVGNVEDILSPAQEESKEEEKTDVPEFRFIADDKDEAPLDINDAKDIIEKGNRCLDKYCIVKEYFKQESDTEQKVSTIMYVNSDGYGWRSFGDATKALGGKKGITERVAGSFWKSNIGIPVGEEITKWTVFKIGDAIRQYAFRFNASAIRKVIKKATK